MALWGMPCRSEGNVVIGGGGKVIVRATRVGKIDVVGKALDVGGGNLVDIFPGAGFGVVLGEVLAG